MGGNPRIYIPATSGWKGRSLVVLCSTFGMFLLSLSLVTIDVLDTEWLIFCCWREEEEDGERRGESGEGERRKERRERRKERRERGKSVRLAIK